MFSPDDVGTKWHLSYSPRCTDENNSEDVDDDFQPPPVLVASCPVKKGGKLLTEAQKYTKFIQLCARAGAIAKLCGGDQFLQRCHAIEALTSCWERNIIEVAVVPVEGKAFCVTEKENKTMNWLVGFCNASNSHFVVL